MQTLLDILGNIGFDLPVAIANFIAFLVIYFILKRYAFGPIQRMLDARKKVIDEGLENARKAETELLMAEQQRQHAVMEGRETANDIVAAARAQEDSIVARAHKSAEEESAHILREGKIQVEREREAMERALRRETAELVVNSVERILKEEFTPEKDEEITKRLVAQS